MPNRPHRKAGSEALLDFNEELPLEDVREQAVDIVEKEYMKRILAKIPGQHQTRRRTCRVDNAEYSWQNEKI